MKKKFLLLSLFATFAIAGPPNSPPHSAPINVQGTESNPLVIKEVPQASPAVVKVLPIEKSAEQRAQEEKDRQEKRAGDKETSSTNRGLLFIGALQALIFACQFLAFAYQSKSLNQTVVAATEQSKDMKRYVDEASRSATAMERMATAMQANVAEVTDAFAMQKIVLKSQLRAYMSVVFLACLQQDRTKDFKFEVQSNLQNNGNSPAIAASTASALRVLPFPLPADVDLTVPFVDFDAAANFPPHSAPMYIRTILPDFLTEEEIAEIKAGDKKRLYVYGTTKYKDVFGESHFTNFCWSIGWNFNGKAIATNVARHNDAT
jgi:hypothetical protein